MVCLMVDRTRKYPVTGTYDPDTGQIELWRADDGEEFEVFTTDGIKTLPTDDFRRGPYVPPQSQT